MSANTFQVTDLRLASCYRALGFRYECKPVIHERSDTLSTQFLFELTSLRFPGLHLQQLHASWKSGELKVKDPMHVLCVMMAAHANYDALLAIIKEGTYHRLKAISGGRMTRYFPGTDGNAITLSKERVQTDDMRLAASVGLLGIPVLDVTEPQRGRHVFHLARHGYAVLLDHGSQHLHDAADLIARAPTPQDPLRLRMEDEQPLHPLCMAYDALYNRTELKRELEKPSLLLIDAPGQRISSSGDAIELLSVKQAFVDINAGGHVMDHVTAHMQSPPIAWK